MAGSVVFKLLCLMVVCVLLTAPKANADIACNQIVSYLTPCISYVLNGGAVPANCCSGISSLNSLAKTSSDRQSVCNCLKNAISSSGIRYTDFNLGLAAGLPQKCGVNIPYKIAPTTDCSRVN
ncbi:Non-specific lipid-transfer protein [Quillaja saponaria]|uniref:Non-specific lipid-transfer protein n=1 Tax=Quillaja saponaria TaxID=32244 RepID=A0AAD7PMK6_QUISA|nr:Non-specific lipid-transfer protein [Quillaja saponaria]